ncbi:MAG TPA: hypothetical protein VFQ30_12965 [Ktedonobacteraceae bacterium]|nr:hypothetical protein [Ktedonobacteraceae bacterium]
MKRFLFKRQLIILGCIIVALCVAIPVAAFAKSASGLASAKAAPVPGGQLTSGKPVNGVVSTPDGISYTFTAVVGKHVTLAITNPQVSPTGTALEMNVYNSSGNADANGVLIGTSPTEIDFTPTSTEVGTTSVVISPYNSGTTGSFTLTYAKDVTGKLTSGVATTGKIKYEGQHADYTFTAVTNQHLTLAITSPHVSPAGTALVMNVYDSSGNADANGVLIGTNSTEIDFTPTSTEAGLTTVVISPYNFGTTGSFTLTYATDVTGTLTSGVATTGTIAYEGQHADYTFKAIVGKHVTLAITNPHVSPAGTALVMNVYNSSSNADANGVLIGTSPTEIDFTPTSTEAGTTTVVISPYNFGTTGSFTLTYAKDVTGKLTSGVATTGKIKYEGQHADYTFTAVTGVPVTLAITNPHVSPPGTALVMNVYDSSGNADANGVLIGTSPTEIDFTPTSTEAGPTTVVISPYNFGTTGSFTLMYTAG